MAVLEAFVYDPLINWRLMQTEVEVHKPSGIQYFMVEMSWSINNVFSETEMSPARAAESATRAAANPQGPKRKLKADENDIFNGR